MDLCRDRPQRWLQRLLALSLCVASVSIVTAAGCSQVVVADRPTNKGGAQALLHSAAVISAVTIFDLANRQVVARLTTQQVRALRGHLGKAQVAADGWTATSPPWDVALVIETTQDRFVAHPVGHCALRLNSVDPFSARIFDEKGRPVGAAELRLNDCVDVLWELLSSHLGPPASKEYRGLPLRAL